MPRLPDVPRHDSRRGSFRVASPPSFRQLPAVRAEHPPTDPTRKADRICAALAVVIGVLIAIWPHLLSMGRDGTWTYIADPDERICYLPLISHSMEVHPLRLGDLAVPTGGVCLYPWVQFVPWILLAKALQGGPLLVLLLWRIWAGASLGFGVFLLGRQLLGGPRAALWLALVCLMDDGLTEGRPFGHQLSVVASVLPSGSRVGVEDYAPFLRQFRLITPGVSWIFLALFVWTLTRARLGWTTRRTAAAAVAFGLLFHAYFYYWSAAGAALAMLTLIEWRDWRRYAAIMVGGGLIGLPAVLANSHAQRTQAEGWLERLDFYRHIGHFEEIGVPKVPLLLLLGTGWWVWRRHRDLLPLWCLAFAGLALRNHQIVTGLQMQNDHFCYAYGATTAILVYVLAVRGLRSLPAARGWWRPVAGAAVIVLGAGALVLRTVEPLRNRWAVENREQLRAFAADRAGKPRLESNAVVAGDPPFTDFAVVLEGQRPLVGGLALSHSVGNAEWERRRVLDLLLRGGSVDEAASLADTYFDCIFAARLQTPAQKAASKSALRAVAAEMLADPRPWLQTFDVRYVAALRDAKTPVSTLSGWQRLPGDGRWQVWQRIP